MLYFPASTSQRYYYTYKNMASLNDCFETENPPTYNREFTGQKSTELFRGLWVGG